MRKLTDHIVPGKVHCNTIDCTDAPGDGGAHHRYEITGFDTIGNKSSTDSEGLQNRHTRLVMMFQNGPIGEGNPPNGIHQEDLLAICIHRLRCFQDGPFKCRENAIALTHLEDALMWLQKRTRDRMARGVEGTHAV